jgi:predicted DNA-binding transcriptional regulator AlpA
MPLSVQVEPDGLNRAQPRANTSQEHRIRPRFVSINEASSYLGCSRSHFYAKLLFKVKTVRLGKRNLVDFDSLEELADELLAAGYAMAGGTAPEALAGALGGRGRSPFAGRRPNNSSPHVAQGARK